VQDFTLVVDHLATKQIEQSAAFSATTDKIATGAGSFTLNVGTGTPITINYDANTSLDDLKKLINDSAGEQVDATVVKISATESRLFISSVGTGASQDISITDNSGLLDTRLTTGLSAIQTGIDNQFTFNGQTVTRSSNQVDDLVAGYKIKLKEPGSAEVSVIQDRETIMSKIDSFVEKYNSVITELAKQTKPSTDSKERGIFSADSGIKSMKRAIEDMISSVAGGVGSMEDYGFSVDKAGKMSLDKEMLNAQLDENPANVEAFFSGGSYTKEDASVVTLGGAFTGFYDIVNEYAKSNGALDLVKTNITESLSILEEKKSLATERLDAKYAIMKKQYAAYDLMISKINSASSMFVQMANAQTASSS